MSAKRQLAHLAGPSLRLQTDDRLVRLSREGHERAFEEIVRRYRAPLVRFAAGIVPADRAEDVVQEALQRAHEAITVTDAELAIRPWLYRVVRNGALNNRRDHRSHEELDLPYDGVPQPPDIAAQREELAATIAAIKALPRSQRTAIVGRELHGLSHEEIAAELVLSSGAARQLIFRARTSLRDSLGGLVPLPLLRSLLEAGSAGAGAAAVGAAGGGIAIKAGTVAMVAMVAIGSGVALHHTSERTGGVAEAQAAPANQQPGDSGAAHRGHSDGQQRSAEPDAAGRHAGGGSRDGAGDDRGGPGAGGGNEGTSGHTGTGPAGGGLEEDEGDEGPSGGDDDEQSGPGGGDDGDELPEPEDDHSGAGGDDLDDPPDEPEESAGESESGSSGSLDD